MDKLKPKRVAGSVHQHNASRGPLPQQVQTAAYCRGDVCVVEPARLLGRGQSSERQDTTEWLFA